MRRILLLPLVICALACGGAGTLIGQDGNVYPHSMVVPIDFRNNDAVAVNMWVEVTEDVASNHSVAPAAGRHLDTTQVWASEDQTKDFKFHTQIGANPMTTVTLSITGTESYAQNFSGFNATWTAANGLTVTTK